MKNGCEKESEEKEQDLQNNIMIEKDSRERENVTEGE